MYKSGTNLNDLRATLGQQDELTRIDSVFMGNKMLTINIDPKTRKWLIQGEEEINECHQQGVMKRSGKGYASLTDTLKELDAEKDVSENHVILALADTADTKNFDGTIKTLWYKIEPCSFGLGDDIKLDVKAHTGTIEYPLVELELSEAEYKACCNSNLALYNDDENGEYEDSGVLYPIQDCAYAGISALLDCSTRLLKEIHNPIITANFLAERIAGKKNLRFVYRKRTERVRPLLGIVGKNYAVIPQKTFVDEVYSEILRSFVTAEVTKWSVSDRLTKVIFTISGTNSQWQPEIEIQISDAVGGAVSAAAYIRLKKGRILVKRNTAYHQSSFKEKGGVQSLLDGIPRQIINFNEKLMQYEGTKVLFKRTLLNPYKRVVGQGRFNKLTIPQEGMYELIDILSKIVDGTSCELNPRWAKELESLNTKVLITLLKEIEYSKQPSLQAI